MVTDARKLELDEETIKGLVTLAKLVNKAEQSGVLEIIQAFLDEGVIDKLAKYIVTPDLLRLLDRLDLLITAGSYLAISMEKKEEPKSLLSLLNTIRKDPEVRLGLAKLIYFLKLLGSIKPEEQ